MFFFLHFLPLQKSILSVLTKTLTTLSAKKSADSLAAIESVSKGMVQNLGKFPLQLKCFLT